jgi:glutamyl-tRNA reductase
VSVVVVGLSHKTAPLEMRERCTVEDLGQAMRELKPLVEEAVPLVTCNRFEIYAYGVQDPDSLISWIAARAGFDVDELREHCYLRSGRNACKHLFFVAASLDSLVIGETQIRGQVKRAYHEATEEGGVGPVLHRLFQTALQVSKEIADNTGVGRGNVSVAGAAADLAGRVFGELEKAQVLVVGAGETAELVVNHLQSRDVERFRVFNRSPEHARELAERCNGEAGGLDELPAALPDADVVVCAAGADEPLITLPIFRKALRRRRGRPVVAIDIAVPRGIDPRVDRIDNVYRYDMDTLTEVTQDALRHRRADFIQCCTMVDAATLRLSANVRAHRAGGAIAELERSFHTVAADELERLERRLPELGDDERERVRMAIHRIVRKLLHMPVRALRESDPEESEVIRRAFGPPGRKRDAQ